MTEELHFEVDDELDGERLDWALGELTDLSRSQAAKLIKDGAVSNAGQTARRPSQKVRAGDALSVVLPEPAPTRALPENIPLETIWADDDVIVINKPPGMVVHPAPGHHSGTLVNALLYHHGPLAPAGGALRPGIVHRIDKETSGLMVCARSDRAYYALQRQFSAHTLHRRYLSLCVRLRGSELEDAGTFSSRHGRDPSNRLRFTGHHGPRHAVTHFRTLERFGTDAALVKCALETGRTHQIRVHLSERGWPLLGDELYGGKAVRPNPLIDRCALHAAELGFVLPDGDEVFFAIAPPADFQHALRLLRSGRRWRS